MWICALPGLRKNVPWRVIATIMASSLSALVIAIAFLVTTFSTCAPLLSIGVMTVKMISSTSITSTIGVTLISLTTAGAFFFSINRSLGSAQEARVVNWRR